jgi:hypothetical protein
MTTTTRTRPRRTRPMPVGAVSWRPWTSMRSAGASPRQPCLRPTPRNCSRWWWRNRCSQDAARENFASMDRSRISVILGVTSAQELLFSMVSRLQRPVWVKALARDRPARRRGASGLRPHRRAVRAVAGSEFPGPARQRRRRTHREPLEPRRHQLRHRCSLRFDLQRVVDGGERTSARSQRPGHRRRRRHA